MQLMIESEQMMALENEPSAGRKESHNYYHAGEIVWLANVGGSQYNYIRDRV